MVIDTSAIVAILAGESEQRAFAQVIEQAEVRLLSAATWVETSTVIKRRCGPAGLHHQDRLLAQAGFETVAVDAEQSRIAREAFQRFGKGRHPAGLNFGDCFPTRSPSIGVRRCCSRGRTSYIPTWPWHSRWGWFDVRWCVVSRP